MPDLRKRLIRLAHENPGEIREAVLPLLKEADFGFGSRILWKLVDQRKVLQVTSNLYKTDKQAAELLTDVTTELIDQLEPKNRRVEAAINRLSGLARGPQDPANLRNQIFKIAHELGMRLPSHSF